MSKRANGVDGRLELLEDDRIRPEMRGMFAGASGPDPCVPPMKPRVARVCASLATTSLVPARVRLVNTRGEELASRDLGLFEATVRAKHMYGNARVTYLVTIDNGAGAGSYSGHETRFAEVTEGTLRWLSAPDPSTGTIDEIVVMSSLKTSWTLSPRTSGRGTDILLFACRPDFDSPDGGFKLIYSRFTFDGGQWREYSRSEPGFWEVVDSPFPPRSAFP